MGGLVIEKVRPGVEFVPGAAAAFRRAEAQVQREFGRNIDVNSTYRSWADQMLMFVNWGKYVNGTGPYPGHSKAVHPSESFHVQGVALDSDDWRVPRIVQILAENGFIRNRLYVNGEEHHFEYIRAQDKNYGKPAGAGAFEEDDMFTDDDRKKINSVFDAIFSGGNSMKDSKKSISQSLAELQEKVGPIFRGGKPVSLRQEVADIKTTVYAQNAAILGMEAALKVLATSKGVIDPDVIVKAARDGVGQGLRDVTFTANIDS